MPQGMSELTVGELSRERESLRSLATNPTVYTVGAATFWRERWAGKRSPQLKIRTGGSSSSASLDPQRRAATEN